MKFLMSHGQATRSTLTFSRVIHFMRFEFEGRLALGGCIQNPHTYNGSSVISTNNVDPERTEAMKDKRNNKPLVGILMGSDSDWPTMKAAADVCVEFGVPHEAQVISAHRTPKDLSTYALSAHKRGLRVIIAGAGGA